LTEAVYFRYSSAPWFPFSARAADEGGTAPKSPPALTEEEPLENSESYDSD